MNNNKKILYKFSEFGLNGDARQFIDKLNEIIEKNSENYKNFIVRLKNEADNDYSYSDSVYDYSPVLIVEAERKNEEKA